MADSPADVLRALVRVFSQRGCRWYVFGAQAVVIHGRPRLTADVDVALEVSPAALPRVVSDLKRRGFVLAVPTKNDFLARTSVIPMIHRPSGMPLDIVLARSGLEAGFLDRAENVSIGGVSVPAINAADLVVSKMLAGRPKDIEDVRGILAQKGRHLDVRHIRTLLAEIETAVDQSDLLPAFERLHAEAKTRRLPRVKRRPAPKRGRSG